MTEVDFPDALPTGSRLHWYVLERVLGQGGFGITYLAHDTNLDRPVAIKEYMPTEIARRRSDASAWPHSDTLAKRYAWGLERFLLEARTLARFEHPNIVRVLSVFEANNTAYMVMRFEEGEDLATQLDRRGTLPQRQLTDCLMPILDGLELVHAAGFIHRDIKPANIYVRRDGSPVLLDFGSARQSFGSAKTLTILVAPGYAPLEQYYGDASTQGPWTDIYGLGATCYRAIAGRAPLEAVARAKGVLGSVREILAPAVEVGRGRYSEAFLAAVDHSLQLSERDRPQNLADWRRELAAGALSRQASIESQAITIAPAPPAHPTLPQPAISPALEPASRVDAKGGGWATSALVVAALAGVVVFWIVARTGSAPASAPSAASSAPATIASPRVDPAASTAPVAQAAVAALPAPAASVEPAKAADAPLTRVVKPIKPVDSTSSPPTSREAQLATRPTKAPAVVSSLTTPAIARPSATNTDSRAASVPMSVAAPVAIPVAAASSPQLPARETIAVRSSRDEAIDVAEAALRRGDANGAAQMLAPLAAAGAGRAQALLGRAQEARTSGGQNDFQAYVWYGIAARNGQAGAQSQRERVGAKLQPAEIRQADQIIERWKPRSEPAPSTSSDRTAP